MSINGSPSLCTSMPAQPPLSEAAKQDIQRLVEDREDHLPDIGLAEKIKRPTDPAAEPWPPMRAGVGL